MMAVPEVELELRSGRINLTHLARTQRACRKEDRRREKLNAPPLTHDEKLDLVEKMKNKLSNEFDRDLAEKFPEVNLKPDVIKQISATHTLIQAYVENDVAENLERLRDLFAHKNFDRSLSALFRQMAEIALDQVDPCRRHAKREKRRQSHQKRKTQKSGSNTSERNRTNTDGTEAGQNRDGSSDENMNDLIQKKMATRSSDIEEQADFAQETNLAQKASRTSEADSSTFQAEAPIPPESGHVRFRSSTAPTPKSRRPYQKISLRDAIFSEADGQCEYVDPVTKRCCNSRHASEVDHVIGFARGGSEERENLRILCRAHNQFEARRQYGEEKTKRKTTKSKPRPDNLN